MKIIRFENKDTTSNTYLLELETKKYIIDPGSLDMNELMTYLRENKINLDGIILTHGHYDHIIGIVEILNYQNINIYICEVERDFLTRPDYSLLYYSNLEQKDLDNAIEKTNVITLKDGEIFEGFKIIHTPGHTKGGICLYNEEEKILISGDTLFKGTYGRVDLPTSNPRDMRDSIRKLLSLDKETKVYPGHSDTTTIGDEYKNYYSSY